MTKFIMPCIAALLLATTAAQAGSFSFSKNGATAPTAKLSLSAGVGPVVDTCTSSDPWGLCDIDDLIARCDAAGGGLSKEPGGGVTCDTETW